MADQRLDAWIPEDLKTYLAERARREDRKMNQVLADILTAERAREQGAIVEQQSLPIIREIVSSELRKQLAQQRTDVQQDMALEFTNEMKSMQRASDNRLAALIVRACRDSSICRRLAYSMLSKSHGPKFAMEVYEDARTKAGKELAQRGNKGEDDE